MYEWEETKGVVVIAKEIAGRYRSRRKLGAGGMGTVYKGLDTQTVLLIAIKQLKPEMASPEITHIQQVPRRQ